MKSTSMPYNLHYCRDCEEEFLSKIRKDKTINRTAYCPLCGENIFVDRIRIVWTKAHLPRFKTYSPEEDAFIIESLKRPGWSYEEISEGLKGRTFYSVKSRVQRLRQKGLVY